eukprot:NODE_811_length_3740_cov_1.483251.p1 type:complete len:298 gc:universal NODE_811_length_3740_cov_1.483251:1134-241(-)
MLIPIAILFATQLPINVMDTGNDLVDTVTRHQETAAKCIQQIYLDGICNIPVNIHDQVSIKLKQFKESIATHPDSKHTMTDILFGIDIKKHELLKRGKLNTLEQGPIFINRPWTRKRVGRLILALLYATLLGGTMYGTVIGYQRFIPKLKPAYTRRSTATQLKNEAEQYIKDNCIFGFQCIEVVRPGQYCNKYGCEDVNYIDPTTGDCQTLTDDLNEECNKLKQDGTCAAVQLGVLTAKQCKEYDATDYADVKHAYYTALNHVVHVEGTIATASIGAFFELIALPFVLRELKRQLFE